MGLINAINCNKDFLGTGVGTCELFLTQEMSGVILVPKGWNLPVTNNNVALTLATAIALVQARTFDPILGSVEFTDNTGDPRTVDYTNSTTSVTGNAKPTYQLRFESGLGFHKAAYSKNTFNTHDAILVFPTGIVGAVSPDGLRFSGLSMGMFNTQTLRLTAGDAKMNTLVNFQLTDEEQFNRRLAVLTNDMLGFSFNSEVRAIQSVSITGTATVGNPILIQISSLGNTGYGEEGFDETMLRVINTANNTVIALDSVTAGLTEGSYELDPTTPLTLGQTLKVYTYDATANENTALLEPNALYRGESPVITVTA